MIRTLVIAVLLAAFLGQGWAQAGMTMTAQPATQSDCAGHMPSDAGCDCCPDGAMATGACAAACSTGFALASVVPEVAPSRGQIQSTYVPPARADPRYLPLNPPPIA